MDFSLLADNHNVLGEWRNVIGAPIISCTHNEYGESGYFCAPAGVYQIRFISDTEVSIAANAASDLGNPLLTPGPIPVICDSTSTNHHVIPGWSIIFNRAVRAGDVAEIGLGCYLSAPGQWRRILSLGGRVIGSEGQPTRLTIRNDTGGTIASCKIVSGSAAIATNSSTLRPFTAFWQAGTLHPDVGDYEVSFGERTSTTTAIFVNNSPIDIYDAAANRVKPSGKGLVCDDSTVYRFLEGSSLQGCHFIVSSGLGASDTVVVRVTGGDENVWLAQPGGEWLPGRSGCQVTEPGQEPGTITSGGSADCDLRFVGSSLLIPGFYAFSLRVVGLLPSGGMTSSVYMGSYIACRGLAELTFRISSAGSHTRPRYSEDPLHPGSFILDDNGQYVEDLQNPGTFILRSQDPNGGNYDNIWTILRNIGIKFGE